MCMVPRRPAARACNRASRWHAARHAANKLLVILGAALACCATSASIGAQEPSADLTIGVLATLDDDDARRQWQPLADGLARRLAPRTVRLAALDLAGIDAAVARGELSFVVTNPGHYVRLEAAHGVTRIATQTSSGGQDPANAVGSAVLMRSDRPQPASLRELAGLRVAAVAEDAFGGYQLIAAEWAREGVDPERGAVRMVFTGFPMTRVIDAVRAGEVDAGIVRTCLLERLEREGTLPAGLLTVVAARAEPALPCRTSTPLYPGWAFAALPRVAPDLSREVLLALLELPPDAAGTRWSVPADYQRVHEVLRTLEVAPYAFLRANRLDALARRYWFVLGALVLLAALAAAYTLRVEVLVKRRTAELNRTLAERDRLARDLVRDHEAMDHLSRLSILGELAATLGHELSHPLATIGNYASSLQRRAQQDTLTPPQLQGGLEEITREADRASQVLQGMRELARKRVGQRHDCDAAALVHESIALFRGLQAHPCEVHVSSRTADAKVSVDPPQFQQVLLNLLKNAQDAMGGTAGCSVRVSVDTEGDEVVIAVEDQGPPLDAAQRERLFEPFYTTKPDGLGLGLPICRGIVEAHGGSLSARPAASRDGRGMVFEVRLPLAATAPRPRQPIIDAEA